MDFVPHDNKEISDLLNAIGINSIGELYQDIPQNLQVEKLNIPDGISEPDLLAEFRRISEKNKQYSASFLGAGSYFHYIPSLVDFVMSRSQFYSAYTPYQAEASQGFLQAIFEYQSAISRLTEMDITNASMYDGASALAEAVILATFQTRKNKILLVKGIHQEYIETVKTYCWGRNIEVEEIELEELDLKVTTDIAGVCFQNPNFFGEIENSAEIVTKIKRLNKKTLIIQCMTDPTCLGVITPPGKTGVDVFVAEGQSFGLPPSFGGPGLGIFAIKEKYLRKMPGRVIGLTKEINGDKEGFVLTLQAREQHIRREKATSNICSNQALCMLSALVYLVSMGKTGLKQIATQNFQKAHFLKNQLRKIPGYEILSQKPTYNEFEVKCPDFNKLARLCKEKNILPPLDLTKYYPDMKNHALVCVTEQNTKEQIETFLKIAEEAAQAN
ncbi:MAG: aminomethyl-transferring glycine dehydrogenase subunit GcvPA [Promethearchaeia archaeon]|nr:MAG: aminomethyl-transferring glycine dehydrogenase subunit GcvPA [Candidatus Lokiarchaeia archaeon]